MGSYYWACYECGASNSIRVQRCRACGYVRPESLTPPPGVATVASEPDLQQSTVEAVASDEPQDPLSKLTRWADANPRWLYVAAAVLLAPLLLMLLGFNASSALGLWFAALAIAVGVKVYWHSGRSFEADFQRLRAEWQKPTTTSAAPAPAAATRVAPPAEASTPPVTTPRRAMEAGLRCPDCAEDVLAGEPSCPYCEHRFDAERLAFCETCQRRVEAMASGMCPACGHRTRERPQAPPEPAAVPPIPAPAPPAPARHAAMVSQAPVAKGAYWGARLMVAAGFIVVIGVFLPWISGYSTYEGSVSLNGLQVFDGSDGPVVIGLGLLLAALGVFASANRRRSGWLRLVAIVVALILGWFAVHDFQVLQQNAAYVNREGLMAFYQGMGTAHASVSVGLYVVGFGVALALLSAILGPPRD